MRRILLLATSRTTTFKLGKMHRKWLDLRIKEENRGLRRMLWRLEAEDYGYKAGGGGSGSGLGFRFRTLG
ncbi:hypothetical protein IGI04_023877 [Brassica rapa subsp. trilocularis]|uniref:Uncharacterized protein n=1 Tax=Brassica rapa subsp. trilocularis TaxID=1813537 RepID=A0ABQ7M8J5_BRACM|nr:hypothetical protein IGI04_023877 [Brassica rapa subsp. trilocularis]